MNIDKDKLKKFLEGKIEVDLTYEDIEKKLGVDLSKSIKENGIGNKHKLNIAFLEAGFVKQRQKNGRITFVKNEEEANKILDQITPMNDEDKDTIIYLNVMFPKTAKYFESGNNLGHEIINLFADDNGKYYYYLNSNGKVKKNLGDKPIIVISISKVGPRLYKVLNKAVVERINYDEKKGEELEYKGISLREYFKENFDDKTKIFYSFECEGFYEPVKPLFISLNAKVLGNNENIINLESTNPGQTTRFTEFNRNDQNKLELMVDDKNWKYEKSKKFKDYVQRIEEDNKGNINVKKFNYFKELGIENQEIQYSNAIKFFLEKGDLVNDFLSSSLKECEMRTPIIISREHYNIDILFTNFDILKISNSKPNEKTTDEKIIILENKINAGITLTDSSLTIKEHISKIYKDVFGKSDKEKAEEIAKELNINLELDEIPSQLSKYYIYALMIAKKRNWDSEIIKENIKCFFLCPQYSKYIYRYNNSDGFLMDNIFVKNGKKLFLQEQYKLITYEEIHNFFKKKSTDIKNIDEKFEVFYEDFVEALKIHTDDRDDTLEQRMIDMFVERSNRLKETNS